jgi:hypothetical protein
MGCNGRVWRFKEPRKSIMIFLEATAKAWQKMEECLRWGAQIGTLPELRNDVKAFANFFGGLLPTWARV